MDTIIIGEDTWHALTKIQEAKAPICVELGAESCANGGVADLLRIANALIAHPYATTARVNGVASIIALTGADTIEMAEKALVYIRPLTTLVLGDIDAQKKALDVLQASTDVVSETLTRWPEAKRIFDAGEERFLSREDAKALGIL